MLTSLFLICLVSSLVCSSRLIILLFVCFTVPSVLTVIVRSFVLSDYGFHPMFYPNFLSCIHELCALEMGSAGLF